MSNYGTWQSKRGVHLAARELNNDFVLGKVLGFKTLGLNVLELQFVMLSNHNKNVLVFVFRHA